MKKAFAAMAIGAALFAAGPGLSHDTPAAQDRLDRNKEIARNFYADLWFSDNTDRYSAYVADSYVVHDVGPRKNLVEPAVEQKNIADIFWDQGELRGEIDYQIAEGDKVATRWRIFFTPNADSFMPAVDGVPIINVFRFDEDGKIVEIWNHRHDVDLPRPPGLPEPGR